jgi:hypothetical protein
MTNSIESSSPDARTYWYGTYHDVRYYRYRIGVLQEDASDITIDNLIETLSIAENSCLLGAVYKPIRLGKWAMYGQFPKWFSRRYAIGNCP